MDCAHGVPPHTFVPHSPSVITVGVWDDAQSWGMMMGSPKAGAMVVGVQPPFLPRDRSWRETVPKV